MNKPQVIWLVIRLAGCFFIWRAAESVFSVLSLFFFTDERLVQQASVLMLQSTLGALVYLLAGLYCLAGGEFIYGVLNRESDTVVVKEQPDADIDEPASESKSTTLGL